MVFAQPMDITDYNVSLRSRIFVPEPGIKSELRNVLIKKLNQDKIAHVYVQFERQLKKKEMELLETIGVKLLSYVSGYMWRAVSDFCL